jgi:predicted RNase H-like nuclease
MILVGVDGCKSGWIVAYRRLDSGEIGTLAIAAVAELFCELRDPAIVAIDIPIGLPERAARGCDVAARQRLGAKRGTSVFPAPIRPLLASTSYADANATSQRIHDVGISQQAWAIYPKIRDVDALLQSRPDLRERIVEIHPEVSFCHWNNGVPIDAGKRTAEGAAIRRALIDAHFGADALVAARRLQSRAGVADDDIADAFAALWTAERIARGESIAYPPDPPRDATGLLMRIVA